MTIRDILLPLTSYPTPTGTRAVTTAVALAGDLAAHVSAMAFELDIQSPIGLYADPVGVRGILAADRKTSAANARALAETFEGLAGKAGVSHDHAVAPCPPLEVSTRLARAARFHDVSLVALKDGDGVGQDIA